MWEGGKEGKQSPPMESLCLMSHCEESDLLYGVQWLPMLWSQKSLKSSETMNQSLRKKREKSTLTKIMHTVSTNTLKPINSLDFRFKILLQATCPLSVFLSGWKYIQQSGE